MVDLNIESKQFLLRFGKPMEEFRHFSAPGRINIIGEHVDYLGGIVLPAAIDFSVHLWISPNKSDQFNLYSLDFDSLVKIKRPFQSSQIWSDYLIGVIVEIEKEGFHVPGFDAFLTGNIPQGAGLSSSASVEVVTGFAISSLFGFKFSREKIALLGQAAENHFVGTKCGIMDQFIIATGKEDHCISLNTETLEYSYHTFDLKGYEFSLINSNVKHSLKDSDYNQRRLECESALKKIKSANLNISQLYEAKEDDLKLAGLSTAEEKRVRHVIGEKNRTQAVVRGLENGDLTSVGKALFETHWSLSKLFEVSCEETDFIVSELERMGVEGARMIGGGFGGCILVLDKIGNFSQNQEEFQKKYIQKFGYPVDFYQFKISDGVREI
ncbi:GHMP kinase [Leptospira ryugenii]|uniref:Galactokinase n=1 Tax=Leptospira ryugenii TaxID=1917863 RepID=A0A2P2E2Z3_9LEPT|nr:galactokinase [Leptospira ryugenii]GBF51273.1 GHMP kinase [Leptospira ryugenii]